MGSTPVRKGVVKHRSGQALMTLRQAIRQGMLVLCTSALRRWEVAGVESRIILGLYACLLTHRALLARLCLVREEVRWVSAELAFATPDEEPSSTGGANGEARRLTATQFARSNVPQRPATFINQLVSVKEPAMRVGLISRWVQVSRKRCGSCNLQALCLLQVRWVCAHSAAVVGGLESRRDWFML